MIIVVVRMRGCDLCNVCDGVRAWELSQVLENRLCTPMYSVHINVLKHVHVTSINMTITGVCNISHPYSEHTQLPTPEHPLHCWTVLQVSCHQKVSRSSSLCRITVCVCMCVGACVCACMCSHAISSM